MKVGRKSRRGRKGNPKPHKGHRSKQAIKASLHRKKAVDYRRKKQQMEEPEVDW